VCAEACPIEAIDLFEIKGETRTQPSRANDCILCMAYVNPCQVATIMVEE